MEFVSAICPQCNKEAKVNPSEEVVFCDFCNKPFKVEEAINLYTQHVERGKAAKKPSAAAIAKFNAILAQDYKLAETYLKDIIKKEYPPECQKHLSFSSYYIEYFWSEYSAFGADNIKKNLNLIRSVNPHIAEMYYQVLCAAVNSMFKTKHNRHYKGQLAFMKWQFHYLENEKSLHIPEYGDDSEFEIEDKIVNAWDKLKKNIAECSLWLKQEYDDEYIDNFISKVETLWSSSSVSYYHLYTKYSLYVDTVLTKRGRSLNDLIHKLEDFYSPAGKKAARERREEAERKTERLEKERKYRQAFEKEVAFWQQYIDLLKFGKAKKALALLEEKKPSNTNEFTKFKKGVFGVKYLGNVSLLSAETFATFSLANLKY